MPVRPSGSGWSSDPRRTKLRAFSGLPPDELAASPSSSHKPDAPLLAREEAVRPTLDDEAVHLLGEQRSAQPLRPLDEDDLGLGEERLEPARSRKPGDPSPDDDDLHAAATPHELRERADEHRVVVQRGRALEPHPELVRGSRARLDVDVEQDLDVVGDESDGDDDDVADAARGQLAEMLAQVRPRPRLGRAPGGLVAPRPALVGEPRALGHEPRGLQALRAVRVAVREQALGKAVRGEDDVDAVAIVIRPAREPLGHPRGERLDQAGGVVVARHVLERDRPR